MLIAPSLFTMSDAVHQLLYNSSDSIFLNALLIHCDIDSIYYQQLYATLSTTQFQNIFAGILFNKCKQLINSANLTQYILHTYHKLSQYKQLCSNNSNHNNSNNDNTVYVQCVDCCITQLYKYSMLYILQPELWNDKLTTNDTIKQFVSYIATVINYTNSTSTSNNNDDSSPARQLSSTSTASAESIDRTTILQFIDGMLCTQSNTTIQSFATLIYTQLINDMKVQNYVMSTYYIPLLLIHLLLHNPKLRYYFIVQSNFIHSWLNGYKVESESLLGILMHLTTLPDEPTVGDKYFQQPLSMTEVEKMFVIQRLRRKLDKTHELLSDIWCILLDIQNDNINSNQHNLTQSALLSWYATLLLSNWSRTKLRSQRRSISNDGFLLNVASVALRVANTYNMFNENTIQNIDQLYVLLPSRIDYSDETMIAATNTDVQLWLYDLYQIINTKSNYTNNNPIQCNASDKFQSVIDTISHISNRAEYVDLTESSPISNIHYNNDIIDSTSLPGTPTSRRKTLSITSHLQLTRNRIDNPSEPPHVGSLSDYAYLSLSTSSSITGACHTGVVCDRCRHKDFYGIRYKCMDCKDYDVCGECEYLEYIDILNNKPCNIYTVLFDCPYRSCTHKQLNSDQIKQHIINEHSSSNEIVQCVICQSNGNQIMLTQPKLSIHINDEHDNQHNSATHTYVKCTQSIPHFNKRQFHRLSKTAEHRSNNYNMSSTNTSTISHNTQSTQYNGVTAMKHQSTVVHHNIQCSNCHTCNVTGILYICTNCSNYMLCGGCERLGYQSHHHDTSHLFFKLRHELTDDSYHMFAELIVQPLYPSAMRGSFSFNLSTEWYYMCMHLLHIGMIKTCARYSTLVQSVDMESDTRKLEPLVKVRHCVDAQLMQSQLLTNTLNIYIFTASYMRNMIDPQNMGLPLSAHIPMQYAALPEYYIDDMADYILFLSRHHVNIINTNTVDIRPLLYLLTILLAQPTYLNNPYLRCKLVEVYCGLCSFNTSHGSGSTVADSIIQNDEFVVTNLLPALIKLYIDIEHTGSDSQFYDKFNVRHAIAVLMRFLIDPITVQQQQSNKDNTINESKRQRKSRTNLHALNTPYNSITHTHILQQQLIHNQSVMFKFISDVMSDLTYLVDESLNKASLLHEQTTQSNNINGTPSSQLPLHTQTSGVMRTSYLQQNNINMSSSTTTSTSRRTANSNTNNIDTERQSNTSRSLRTASVLATHTINLLWTLIDNTQLCAWLLNQNELIDRLSNTINQYMIRISHTKSFDNTIDTQFNQLSQQQQLSITSNHNPFTWLALFIDMYVRLRHNTQFIHCAIKNGFQLDIYHNVLQQMSERQIQSYTTASELNELTELLIHANDMNTSELLVLGDIPDEYCDPILNSLMIDPVILPTSGITMDRTVITRHLQSQQTDPFNRLPLTVDKLIPNTTLQQQIHTFTQHAKLRSQNVISNINTLVDDINENTNNKSNSQLIDNTMTPPSPVSAPTLHNRNNSSNNDDMDVDDVNNDQMNL